MEDIEKNAGIFTHAHVLHGNGLCAVLSAQRQPQQVRHGKNAQHDRNEGYAADKNGDVEIKAWIAHEGVRADTGHEYAESC